ncbi:MAG: hypothetical protein ACLGHF_00805 [Alphaproteobacteria bacterium]
MIDNLESVEVLPERAPDEFFASFNVIGAIELVPRTLGAQEQLFAVLLPQLGQGRLGYSEVIAAIENWVRRGAIKRREHREVLNVEADGPLKIRGSAPRTVRVETFEAPPLVAIRSSRKPDSFRRPAVARMLMLPRTPDLHLAVVAFPADHSFRFEEVDHRVVQPGDVLSPSAGLLTDLL